MDKIQADAIAKAILEPDLATQEEIRLKRAREDAYGARKRRVAVFVLVGSGIGAIITYYLGHRFTLGIIWGGVAGTVLGWLLTMLRSSGPVSPSGRSTRR